MALVNSKQHILKPAQIIEIAAEETKEKASLKEVKTLLLKEFSLPGSWKCQEGNTIFIVHTSKKPRYGVFRAINADTAQNYLENSKEFAKAAYEVGYDVLITQFTDPAILQIFKAISRNPVQDKMGYVAQKLEHDAGYQVTLMLGPQRGAK
jgi:hypothetical protein